MTVGSRLISLCFALSSLAVFICSLQATSVTALTVEHAARDLHHRGHDALAKRKRSNNTKRCKPRPASALSTPVSHPAASSPPAPAPAPPKQSPKPAPAPPPPSNNGGGSAVNPDVLPTFPKNALAWPNGDANLGSWRASIIYTWSPGCPQNHPGKVCCPMLWGTKFIGEWTQSVMNTSPKCVMGFNEPEISGQSNMSPQDGFGLWNKFIRPMKSKGAQLFSPATTSDPAGEAWMDEFYRLCGPDKCGATHHALHWYDVNADALIAYLQHMHNKYGLPLFLSEFACQNFNGGPQCSFNQVWAFQAKVTAFFLETDYVHYFAAFGAMNDLQGVNTFNQIMDSGSGAPNALGRAYGY